MVIQIVFSKTYSIVFSHYANMDKMLVNAMVTHKETRKETMVTHC